MSVTEDVQDGSLNLPERTVAQLNELVRNGRFKNQQAAVAAAVERLYADKPPHLNARQQAFARLCGALRLGSTRQSLRDAECERLDWESGQR